MPGRSRVLPVAYGLALLVVVLAVGALALARARELLLANHDIGWFLHAGSVWLDGGKIGVDVIDTNPPLVIWLAGLEVWLARALGAIHPSLPSPAVNPPTRRHRPASRRRPPPPSAITAESPSEPWRVRIRSSSP
jgi:hypothetical protein